MKIANKENLNRFIVILLVIAAIVVISVFTVKNNTEVPGIPRDTVSLFNGTDLNDWQIILASDSIPTAEVFFVSDGVIQSTGLPFGYIRTKTAYSDYQLLVEWRWPEEPGNSGVFLHIGEDKIWPVCLECQLKSGNAGDFVAFPGFNFREHTDTENWAVPKMDDTSEKLAGEWNKYDIRVVGDSVSIYVNGTLQNIATATSKTEGFIALQSEGAPIQFRNILLIQNKDEEISSE